MDLGATNGMEAYYDDLECPVPPFLGHRKKLRATGQYIVRCPKIGFGSFGSPFIGFIGFGVHLFVFVL